jgi:hypothetical protein
MMQAQHAWCQVQQVRDKRPMIQAAPAPAAAAFLRPDLIQQADIIHHVPLH